MTDPTIFEELFVYDLANNHMGDMAHAEMVIREVAKASNKAGVRGALKFQFRQLDTFIHPDFQDRMDIKYVKRFAETRLENQSFERLADVVRESGLLTMCTPFDEASVDVICDQGIDIIKIASCSADDWPLLRKVSTVNKPLVVSTAGLRLDEIDRLVSFLQSQNCRFAIMHCVALYPTPDENLELDQVRQLRRIAENVAARARDAAHWISADAPPASVTAQVQVLKSIQPFLINQILSAMGRPKRTVVGYAMPTQGEPTQ